jgi:anti-sigma-K factor RskA
VTHLSLDRLAGQALNTDDPLTPAEQNHLVNCAECREELAELSRIAELSGEPEHTDSQLVHMESIWHSIQAQVRKDSSAAAATITTSADASPTPATITKLPDRIPRRRWFLVAAAAALFGLIIGAGITTVAFRDRVEVTSRIALNSLPGHTGHGTAELISDRGHPELRVRIDAPPAPDNYREVWLINTDGRRMYTLGVLPDNGRATYPLPPELAGQLHGFNIVDVSIEPYDGNPAHSRNSQVRGVLPT